MGSPRFLFGVALESLWLLFALILESLWDRLGFGFLLGIVLESLWLLLVGLITYSHGSADRVDLAKTRFSFGARNIGITVFSKMVPTTNQYYKKKMTARFWGRAPSPPLSKNTRINVFLIDSSPCPVYLISRCILDQAKEDAASSCKCDLSPEWFTGATRCPDQGITWKQRIWSQFLCLVFVAGAFVWYLSQVLSSNKNLCSESSKKRHGEDLSLFRGIRSHFGPRI